MPDLPPDVWLCILEECGFDEFAALRGVCRPWRALFRSADMDRGFALVYARGALSDERFWEKAKMRPPETRKSLPTYFDEMVRIERFRRGMGASRLAADEIYYLWENFMDTPQAVAIARAANAKR